MNHYEALGVARGADPAQIKAAYGNALRQAHPDKASQAARRGAPPAGAAPLAAILAAYAVLKEPATRADYDAGLDAAAVRAVGIIHEDLELDDLDPLQAIVHVALHPNVCFPRERKAPQLELDSAAHGDSGFPDHFYEQPRARIAL